MSKALVVIDIQNDITKHYKDIIDKVNNAISFAQSQGMYVVYIKHNNITVGTRTFKPSDCITSYDLKKVDNMLKYYEDKGCEVKRLFSFLSPSWDN